MKIKKDSKLYKALKFANTQAYIDLRFDGKTTLCNITLGLFAATILSTFVLAVSSGVVVFLSVLLFTLLVSPFTDIWTFDADKLLFFTTTLCGIIWFALLCCVIRLGLHSEGVTPEYLKRWLNLKEEPSNSLLSRWLKDRKEKICTIVTLEE